jgi:3-oxoadipate CoA-transferase, beta subunit
LQQDFAIWNFITRLRSRAREATAAARVKRIYTNLAVIDVTPQGLSVVEMIPGMTLEKLQTLTEPKLQLASHWQALAPPEARAA